MTFLQVYIICFAWLLVPPRIILLTLFFFLQIGHYVNDYSELWLYTGELEKEKAALNTAKSSLEAENAHLNKLASKEGKKRVRAKDREKELKNELSKVKSQLDTIARRA